MTRGIHFSSARPGRRDAVRRSARIPRIEAGRRRFQAERFPAPALNEPRGDDLRPFKRRAGEWHPVFQIIATIAFPLIYAAYLGVAEQARYAGAMALGLPVARIF